MIIHIVLASTILVWLADSQSSSPFRCRVRRGREPNLQDSSCESYYTCTNYTGQAQRCSGGQQFHYRERQCKPESQVWCNAQRRNYRQFLAAQGTTTTPAPATNETEMMNSTVPDEFKNFTLKMPEPMNETEPVNATEAPATTQAPNTTANPAESVPTDEEIFGTLLGILFPQLANIPGINALIPGLVPLEGNAPAGGVFGLSAGGFGLAPGAVDGGVPGGFVGLDAGVPLDGGNGQGLGGNLPPGDGPIIIQAVIPNAGGAANGNGDDGVDDGGDGDDNGDDGDGVNDGGAGGGGFGPGGVGVGGVGQGGVGGIGQGGIVPGGAGVGGGGFGPGGVGVGGVGQGGVGGIGQGGIVPGGAGVGGIGPGGFFAGGAGIPFAPGGGVFVGQGRPVNNNGLPFVGVGGTPLVGPIPRGGQNGQGVFIPNFGQGQGQFQFNGAIRPAAFIPFRGIGVAARTDAGGIPAIIGDPQPPINVQGSGQNGVSSQTVRVEAVTQPNFGPDLGTTDSIEPQTTDSEVVTPLNSEPQQITQDGGGSAADEKDTGTPSPNFGPGTGTGTKGRTQTTQVQAITPAPSSHSEAERTDNPEPQTTVTESVMQSTVGPNRSKSRVRPEVAVNGKHQTDGSRNVFARLVAQNDESNNVDTTHPYSDKIKKNSVIRKKRWAPNNENYNPVLSSYGNSDLLNNQMQVILHEIQSKLVQEINNRLMEEVRSEINYLTHDDRRHSEGDIQNEVKYSTNKNNHNGETSASGLTGAVSFAFSIADKFVQNVLEQKWFQEESDKNSDLHNNVSQLPNVVGQKDTVELPTRFQEQNIKLHDLPTVNVLGMPINTDTKIFPFTAWQKKKYRKNEGLYRRHERYHRRGRHGRRKQPTHDWLNESPPRYHINDHSRQGYQPLPDATTKAGSVLGGQNSDDSPLLRQDNYDSSFTIPKVSKKGQTTAGVHQKSVNVRPLNQENKNLEPSRKNNKAKSRHSCTCNDPPNNQQTSGDTSPHPSPNTGSRSSSNSATRNQLKTYQALEDSPPHNQTQSPENDTNNDKDQLLNHSTSLNQRPKDPRNDEDNLHLLSQHSSLHGKNPEHYKKNKEGTQRENIHQENSNKDPSMTNPSMEITAQDAVHVKVNEITAPLSIDVKKEKSGKSVMDITSMSKAEDSISWLVRVILGDKQIQKNKEGVSDVVKANKYDAFSEHKGNDKKHGDQDVKNSFEEEVGKSNVEEEGKEKGAEEKSTVGEEAGNSPLNETSDIDGNESEASIQDTPNHTSYMTSSVTSPTTSPSPSSHSPRTDGNTSVEDTPHKAYTPSSTPSTDTARTTTAGNISDEDTSPKVYTPSSASHTDTARTTTAGNTSDEDNSHKSNTPSSAPPTGTARTTTAGNTSDEDNSHKSNTPSSAPPTDRAMTTTTDNSSDEDTSHKANTPSPTSPTDTARSTTTDSPAQDSTSDMPPAFPLFPLSPMANQNGATLGSPFGNFPFGLNPNSGQSISFEGSGYSNFSPFSGAGQNPGFGFQGPSNGMSQNPSGSFPWGQMASLMGQQSQGMPLPNMGFGGPQGQQNSGGSFPWSQMASIMGQQTQGHPAPGMGFGKRGKEEGQIIR